MEIDLAPILQLILAVVVPVFGVLGVYLIHTLAGKLGLEKDTQLAAFLEDALHDGLRVAEKRLGKAVQDADVTIQNEMAAQAADWAIENAPKAVKRLVPGGRSTLIEMAKSRARELLGVEAESAEST